MAEHVPRTAQHRNNMGQHTPNMRPTKAQRRTAGFIYRSSVANTPVRAVVVAPEYPCFFH